MTEPTKAMIVTQKHIARVNELLTEAADELIRRGAVHDLSKFSPEEMGPLEEMQKLVDTEGQAAFGTPEYERRKLILGPMLEHHYKNNSHHPEHYPAGVNGMNLFDLIEMFFDWKAASERGEESAMNLTFSAERYKLAPQVFDIFKNTAAMLNYPVK